LYRAYIEQAVLTQKVHLSVCLSVSLSVTSSIKRSSAWLDQALTACTN